MLPTHAVGIDLGTTYSCIAYLNEHGEPVSIPNKDGELSTPSVVLFDGSEVIVGTEALRNSILHPDRVVVHAKRNMGNPAHCWKIGGKSYNPVDISTYILKSLLDNAREKIGAVERAVITVPAQFSDVQRQATAEAGKRAGLKTVDIINEPVAAALCFVLGTEGIWFTELATTQTVMVVDLGGGTFDLSLVKYQKNEVSVIASGGDLYLGGLDWNKALETAIGKQFQKEFGVNPMEERETAQALALEAEQTKRSLSVRPKAAMTVAAGAHRKTYQVEVEQFERLTKDLIGRMEQLTVGLLKERNMGWARVDVVLTTGGSSRMPMVRSMLKRLSGRTLNTSLSPDQSIAHGATYYAGMLLTNSGFAKSILNPVAAARLSAFKQRSVNARALGVLIRDQETGNRVPHYILPANTQLPTSVTQVYGTVSENQRKVHLRIVESGTAADATYVELGTCRVEELPENLPEATEIEVTIRYDEQARVHVSAKVLATGQQAQTEIIRPENLTVSALHEETEGAEVFVKTDAASSQEGPKSSEAVPRIAKPIQPNLAAKVVTSNKSVPAAKPRPAKGSHLEDSSRPIPLCNQCGEPLDPRGKCAKCEPSGLDLAQVKANKPKQVGGKIVPPRPDVKSASAKTDGPIRPQPPVAKEFDEARALRMLLDEPDADPSQSAAKSSKAAAAPKSSIGSDKSVQEMDDSEFWRTLGQE